MKMTIAIDPKRISSWEKGPKKMGRQANNLHGRDCDSRTYTTMGRIPGTDVFISKGDMMKLARSIPESACWTFDRETQKVKVTWGETLSNGQPGRRGSMSLFTWIFAVGKWLRADIHIRIRIYRDYETQPVIS